MHLSLFQVCMRLTLPCLHVCHSICMRTPWEGAIGMGERVGSYCGCTCSQSGTDGRGTSGKSGVKKLRRRALREKLNFLRRKPKRTGGSTTVRLYARSLAHARGGSQHEEKILLLPPFTPRPYYVLWLVLPPFTYTRPL